MANPILNIDTQHTDMIHDCALDFYGRKMATCSSDRVIKIFNIVGEQEYQHVADLSGHGGPVWEVAFAHPKFGTILASCSHDEKVLIHREESQGKWQIIYEYTDLKSSINSIAWGDAEYGLSLACCSSNGKVSILSHNSDNTWTAKVLEDCPAGVLGVTWAPFGALGSVDSGAYVKRLATAGCDNLVRIWAGRDNGSWEIESTLSGHNDWVRDVAWAPSIGLPYNMIASCSEDGTVIIWTQVSSGGEWSSVSLPVSDTPTGDSKKPVWRVSWSVTGNVLAVSSGDADVSLWKQSLDKSWVQVSTVEDPDAPTN